MQIMSLIDTLRIQNNLYIEDFVAGICSSRQYRRYISGDQQISNKVLTSFLDRLGLDFIEFIKLKEEKEGSIRIVLFKQLDLLNDYNYSEVRDNIVSIKLSDLESNIEVDLYNFLKIITDYHLSPETGAHTKFMLSKLIQYPGCLNKKFLNQVEENGLVYIVKLSDDPDEKFRILSKLQQVSTLNSVDFRKSLITNTNLVQQLLVLNRYDETIQRISDIEKIVSNSVELKTLINLYYFKMLSQRHLGLPYKSSLITLQSLCELEGNLERLAVFKKDYMNTFGDELLLVRKE